MEIIVKFLVYGLAFFKAGSLSELLQGYIELDMILKVRVVQRIIQSGKPFIVFIIKDRNLSALYLAGRSTIHSFIWAVGTASFSRLHK
jgi:uncharacterized MAPEG superfamily protein